ncbi:MAG: hypothetical protein JNJ71_17310 [Rubrivivax sp.]|nr:hypothetical protein [Rubrivivax sp.]
MTDQAKAQREIARFFTEQMMPLAERLKADRVKLLDPGPQPGAASYFVKRTQRSMSREDFERGGLTSPERAEAEMKAVWSQAAGHPLAPLAPAVARLAGELRQGQTQSSDVSQFVYAMY